MYQFTSLSPVHNWTMVNHLESWLEMTNHSQPGVTSSVETKNRASICLFHFVYYWLFSILKVFCSVTICKDKTCIWSAWNVAHHFWQLKIKRSCLCLYLLAALLLHPKHVSMQKATKLNLLGTLSFLLLWKSTTSVS